jgi:hypothetical protein
MRNRRAGQGWLLRFHLGDVTVAGTGLMDVRRGERRAGRWAGALLRLPPTGTAVPTRVRVVRAARRPDGAAVERWERAFGRRSVRTWVVRRGDRLTERLGPLELRMRLRADAAELWVRTDGAALGVGALRLPLPGRLAPRAVAHAWSPPGRTGATFHVEVRVTVPGVGTILSYRGRLAEEVDA